MSVREDTTSLDQLVGRTLGGRYRLTARIARGGMASVYRARDEVLQRDVAVKVMHPDLPDYPSFLERFRREAQAAARLNHRNIAAVFDWGREDSAAYMVLELVEGPSLREVIDARGALSPTATAEIIAQAAAALDHAHRMGVVHSDVKPENLLLTMEGDVRVVDFGIARALTREATPATKDTVAGTAHYLAPEQLRGEGVDARTDVYALGIVAYEALTGEVPFEGDSPEEVASRHLAERVPPPSEKVPDIPPEVDAAVLRATDPDPAGRFESAGDFAVALGKGRPAGTSRDTAVIPTMVRETVPSIPVVKPPARYPARGGIGPAKPQRPGKRHRWPVLVVVLAMLAGTAAYGYASWWPVKVPSLGSMDLTAARKAAEAVGLHAVQAGSVTDERIPKGAVTRQVPLAGDTLHRRGTIKVWLSSGPQLFALPDLAGKSFNDAKAAIVAAHMTVGDTVEEVSETVAKGLVVRTDPIAGNYARGTPVKLVVSKGKPQVAVADVTGRPFAEAEKILEDLGFKVTRLDAFSDTVAKDAVMSSNPPSGRVVDKGSTVTLTVSKGPYYFPVPDVRGQSKDKAAKTLTSLGLKVDYRGWGNYVYDQSPAPGESVKKGDTVTLLVGRAP
ncbi:MAG: Stk1 family PASTA domain-containing Ser/Thr kinase [Actinomycetota bacterium]